MGNQELIRNMSIDWPSDGDYNVVVRVSVADLLDDKENLAVDERVEQCVEKLSEERRVYAWNIERDYSPEAGLTSIQVKLAVEQSMRPKVSKDVAKILVETLGWNRQGGQSGQNVRKRELEVSWQVNIDSSGPSGECILSVYATIDNPPLGWFTEASECAMAKVAREVVAKISELVNSWEKKLADRFWQQVIVWLEPVEDDELLRLMFLPVTNDKYGNLRCAMEFQEELLDVLEEFKRLEF